ncbi:MAG: type II toxin-antitoxin system RelE/ParE family toxin, partial [Candidatus Izimaplasma sp.]|nr:type II toxin-antitoxin system RelE/ParE family toxin [Candidatus Izimaplasma bacterium]
MVNKYIVYQDAVEDFNQIVQYITYSLKNQEGAIKLIQLFESKLDLIMSFPDSYPIIYDSKLESSDLRKCKMDNYLIIYILNQELEQIEIVRVIYQREDYL